MVNEKEILLFKGDSEICYGIFESFSIQLKTAFESLGQKVYFFDKYKNDIRECLGKEYKAVIGFMETFFYNNIPGSNTKLFDLIIGPKFNYWTDHPAYYYQYINDVPKDFYVLTLDRNYVQYINKFFKGITAFFLPPGGINDGVVSPYEKRKYDVSFLGTYMDYRKAVTQFDSGDRVTTYITETYLNYLIQNPKFTTEKAFSDVLKLLGAEISEEQFLRELQKIHYVATYGAARYYKEKVIETILNSGIVLDVFSDSWKQSPFANRANLRIHPEIGAKKYFYSI